MRRVAELGSLDRTESHVKFKVHRHVGAQALRGLIPKRYHSQFRWSEFDAAQTALLLFRYDQDDVVISSIVSRALHSTTDLSEQFRVAVGGNFTTEAASFLAEAGFHIYTLRDLTWTDESYKSLTKAV